MSGSVQRRFSYGKLVLVTAPDDIHEKDRPGIIIQKNSFLKNPDTIAVLAGSTKFSDEPHFLITPSMSNYFTHPTYFKYHRVFLFQPEELGDWNGVLYGSLMAQIRDGIIDNNPDFNHLLPP